MRERCIFLLIHASGPRIGRTVSQFCAKYAAVEM
ncbi:hypothetical protein DT23_08995 [Thioclava indica]|uniref:Uncharacterized protein n=1 Tax=Thioclava indica TaxID=1353528 RepID=A0A074JPU2_9RHOB|nr:hypothetical protein DT23_08995 [Thioclava indica]